MGKKRIAIFASGAGSNAARIMDHFADNDSIDVVLVLSNKATAGVLDEARSRGVDAVVFDRTQFNSGQVLEMLREKAADLVVLAGFLWKVPEDLVKAFPNAMVNIHPALLPKFGGKGMYGHHVHEAVYAAREKESGITIHFVNEKYDDGAILFQASFPIEKKDDAAAIESMVRALEMRHFAPVIEDLLTD